MTSTVLLGGYADSEYDIVNYVIIINLCCCFGTQSNQTSELCQKRGFNSSTGIIVYADSEYDIVSYIW